MSDTPDTPQTSPLLYIPHDAEPTPPSYGPRLDRLHDLRNVLIQEYRRARDDGSNAIGFNNRSWLVTPADLDDKIVTEVHPCNTSACQIGTAILRQPHCGLFFNRDQVNVKTTEPQNVLSTNKYELKTFRAIAYYYGISTYQAEALFCSQACDTLPQAIDRLTGFIIAISPSLYSVEQLVSKAAGGSIRHYLSQPSTSWKPAEAPSEASVNASDSFPLLNTEVIRIKLDAAREQDKITSAERRLALENLRSLEAFINRIDTQDTQDTQ